MEPLDDTIVAIASPPGGAARGIVRVSGPDAVDCLKRLFQSEHGRAPSMPRRPQAIVGRLHVPNLHSPLPCDVYLWPEGRSYTGQAVVELHTLGSMPLLDLVLRSICAAGARLARPGEFTLRAFLAGRIDLTQAEAVLGVIDADDADALKTALAQLAGGLARPMHRLRDELVELLAHVEAGFDFADEDLTFITRDSLVEQLAQIEIQIAAVHRQMAFRSESRHAVHVTLVGRPNSGKSSLFNALAGEPSALVSKHPGTTRDYLTTDLDLDGLRCRLIDTAGTTGGGNEAIGDIERAAESAAATQQRGADLQIFCLDSTRRLDTWERHRLAFSDSARQMIVLTKCDLPRQCDDAGAALETSVKTGAGIGQLRDELRRRLLLLRERGGNVVVGTAVRCAESLRLAGQCLQNARHVALGDQHELAAAEIRTALTELGQVVGEIYTDDILDRIFSRFCVGK